MPSKDDCFYMLMTRKWKPGTHRPVHMSFTLSITGYGGYEQRDSDYTYRQIFYTLLGNKCDILLVTFLIVNDRMNQSVISLRLK